MDPGFLSKRTSSTWIPSIRWTIRGLTLAACLLGVSSAFAEAPPAREDAEVSARLSFLVSALERDEPRMRLWYDSWTSAFAGLSVAQAGVALGVDDRSTRISSIAGSIKAAIGVVGMIARPAAARTAATTLRGRSEVSPDDRRTKLALAESLLHKSADQERGRRGWPALLGAAIINLAGACVVWVGYHEYRSGWIGLGGGVAVAQAQLWTQPRGASAAWSAYSRGSYQGPPPPPPPIFSWSILPSPNGLSLLGSF